jgi:hypothetical protein
VKEVQRDTARQVSIDLLDYLPKHKRDELQRLIEEDPELWRPLPGPQSAAFSSPADIVGYGGAAGGGKTDLACGLTLTSHRKIGIFRRNGTELEPIVDRIATLYGNRDGFNGQKNVWRLKRPDGTPVLIEFCSYPNLGDEQKQQGHDRDLYVFDEASNQRESQVRFVMGWLRSTFPGQRKRVLMTFNPPTDVEGRWIVRYFAPWLDKKHKNPAKPGELRWFAVDTDGEDIEVPDDRPFVWDDDGERCYDFDEADYQGERSVRLQRPMSRTFIPSRVTDNPFLANSGYVRNLQSLPEPLRSMMLFGDFSAGLEDDPFQVIPTQWVEDAMKRWRRKKKRKPMDSMGVDIARGGKDKTILFRRHGMWIDDPIVYPGENTPDGATTSGLIIAALRDQAPIHIDVVGVGSSPYDFLRNANQQVIGINAGNKTEETDKAGVLAFGNKKTAMWWKLREALDPTNNTGIQLPDCPELLADLTLPKWDISGRVITMWTRKQMVERLGRSPDYGSALVLAMEDTPKRELFNKLLIKKKKKRGHDPMAPGRLGR